MEIQKYEEDFSKEQKEALEEYVTNGCPGLVKITESKIFEWFELYMSGKSYEEIATITASRRDAILYVSHKSKWNEKKMKYISNLTEGMQGKIVQTKLESLNTIQSIVSALGKNIQSKTDDYIRTKNEEVLAKINKEDIRNYFKSVEILDKLISQSISKEGGDNSLNLNINIGGSSEVSQKDDNTIEVTSGGFKSSDILRKLSEEKKKKEEFDKEE